MADKPTSKPGASATSAEMAQAEKLLAGQGGHGSKEKGDAAAKGGGHGDKPAAAPKKKKGKKASGPSIGARVKQAVAFVKAQAVEIFKGLRSPDRPTQRMSLFFFVSLFTMVGLGVMSFRLDRAAKRERREQEVARLERAADRAHETEVLGRMDAPGESPGVVSMMDLGQFTVELKVPPLPEGQKRNQGLMNMAELQLVVECDSKETRDFIEENLVQVRSQLTDVFVSIGREELLSREGKRKLKKRLLERINGWLPHGKVQNAFFSNLVVA